MSDPTIDPDAFRRFEQARHDQIAPTYEQFFLRFTRHALDPLLQAAGAAPGVRLLDVACGPGHGTARAAALGASASGVDLSPGMLAQARLRHPGIDFRAADAQVLPFADGHFDAVVCSFGLGHFPDAPRALAEFTRVTAPGGRVAVSWWDGPERSRIQGVFADALREAGARHPEALPAGPPVFRYSEPAALQALLAQAGLEDIAIHTVAGVEPVESADAFWAGAMGGMARSSAAILGQSPAVRDLVRQAFGRLVAPMHDGTRLQVPYAFHIAAGRRPRR